VRARESAITGSPGTDSSPDLRVKAISRRMGLPQSPSADFPCANRLGADCIVWLVCLELAQAFRKRTMGQVNQLEIQFARALDRLREAIATRAPAGEGPEAEQLRQRVAALENDKAKLLEELVSIRARRDKDVAALDQLIAQLKPLIEEA
jgi:hypothetical protein